MENFNFIVFVKAKILIKVFTINKISDCKGLFVTINVTISLSKINIVLDVNNFKDVKNVTDIFLVNKKAFDIVELKLNDSKEDIWTSNILASLIEVEKIIDFRLKKAFLVENVS